MASKVTVTAPIAELDGDESTRSVWKHIKDLVCKSSILLIGANGGPAAGEPLQKLFISQDVLLVEMRDLGQGSCHAVFLIGIEIPACVLGGSSGWKILNES
eukprot:5253208-Amphidinium_carterae.1